MPDSCCLTETPHCGQGVFQISDLRKVIGKIHTHGCITTMLRSLDTHVTVRQQKRFMIDCILTVLVPQAILIVFTVAGFLIALVELLGVVLSCCLASHYAALEQESEAEWRHDFGQYEEDHEGRMPRSPTPQTIVSQAGDASSHHETAF